MRSDSNRGDKWEDDVSGRHLMQGWKVSPHIFILLPSSPNHIYMPTTFF